MNVPSAINDDSESSTFLVTDGTDPLRSMRVLVVKPLQCPKVEILQSNLISRRSILYLNTDTRSILTASDTHLVSFTKPSQSPQTGLLLRIPVVADAYQLIEIDGTSPYVTELLKSNTEIADRNNDLVASMNSQESYTYQEPLSSTHVHDPLQNQNHITESTPSALIAAWGAKQYASLLANDAWVPPAISMRRPATTQTILPQSPQKIVQYNLSPQNEQNPKDFIISRYYNTLYSLTTPLSYFPKTAFNRLRSMCKESPSELLDAISGALISTEILSKRQIERFGLPALISGEASPMHVLKFEHENQQHFVSRHYDDLMTAQKLEKLVMDLKIREAQLQVLVIMEFLLCLKIDETKFLENNAHRQEKENQTKAKRSLVRKRTKKRIIPTLLGQGMDDSASSQATNLQNENGNEFSLYKSLISLIDQLGIWGVLQAKSSSRNDEHTYGFLAYVLVPYYNKSLPQIMQFIIKSFKNFQISFKLPKKSASRQSSTSSRGKNDEPNEAGAKRKLKFSKTHLSPSKLPLLKRSSSTMDASDLKPAFLLKRSKSSLGSKNMQKRQVEMLGKTEKSEEQLNEELKSQSSFLFCDARKIKSVSMATTSTRELPQVEATPTKPTLAARAKLNPVSADVPQVFATPSNVRVIDRLNIESSGMFKSTRSSRQKTVFEKLSSVDLEEDVRSPAQLSNSSSNVFLNETYNGIIRSSPEKVISSPAKVSTAPGQQISINSSPVYFGQDGLPKDLRIKTKRIKLAPASQVPSEDSNPKREPPKLRKIEQISEESTDIFLADTRLERPSVQKGLKRQNGVREASAAMASLSSLDVFRDTSFVKTQSDLEAPKNTAKVSSHSFSFNSADTDSDSDLEKLMAAPRAPIKKYPRKK